MKLRTSNVILLGAVSLILILFQSCGTRGGFAGTYVSAGGGTSIGPEITIELNNDGKGVWKKLDEKVFFSWEVKHKELRLHLKLGGVIIGKIKHSTIEISLPGSENLRFEKVENS